MTDFKSKNQIFLEKRFQEYANELGHAGVCDIVIIMREYFGDESSFTFYLDEKDTENLFDKVNSLKILLKQIDVFIFEIIRADKSLYLNSKYVSMSYELFWSIL